MARILIATDLDITQAKASLEALRKTASTAQPITVKVNTSPVDASSITKSAQQSAQVFEQAFNNKDVAKNINTTTQALVGMNTQAAKTGDTIGKLIGKVALWSLATSAIYTPLRGIKDALAEMKAVDDEMVVIRKVTGMTAEELEVLEEQAYSTAKALGIAASEYLSATAAFSRAGYKQQADELGELAVKTQLVGDMAQETANQFLLSVDAAYQLEGNISALSRVLDGANEIDNKYATSMEKIAEGLGKVAPIAAQAKIGIEEVSASLGTITAVTQRSGTEAATAYRALILNILGDTTTEIEDGATWTAGEIAGLRDVIKTYAPAAYEAAEATGSLINPMEAIGGLAQAMQDGLLTEQKLMEMVSDIGGKLRTSQLLALIQNWDMYESMVSDFTNSMGSADAEVENALDSWTKKTQIFSNTWTEFVATGVDVEFFKGLIDLGTGTIDVLGNLGNTLGLTTGLMLTFNGAAMATGGIKFVQGMERATVSLITYSKTLFNATARATANATAETLATHAKNANTLAEELNTKAMQKSAAYQTMLNSGTASEIELEIAATAAVTANTNAMNANAAAQTANAAATRAAGTALTGVLGIVGLAITAYSILSMVVGQYNQAQEEVRQETIDAGTAAKDQIDYVNGLADAYKKAHEAGVDITSSGTELATAIGYAGEAAATAAINYEKLTEEAQAYLLVQQALVDVGKSESLKELQGDIRGWNSTGAVSGSGLGAGMAAQAGYAAISYDRVTGEKEVLPDIPIPQNADEAFEVYEELNQLMGDIITGYGSDWATEGVNDPFNRSLLAKINFLKEYVEELGYTKDAQDDMADSDSGLTELEKSIRAINDGLASVEDKTQALNNIKAALEGGTFSSASAEEITALVEEFPQLTDEIEDYVKAVQSGIDPTEAQNKLLAELSSEISSLETERLKEGIESIISATEEWGNSSHWAQSALEDLTSESPALKAVLFDVETGTWNLSDAAYTSAAAMLEETKQMVQAEITAQKLDLANAISQFDTLTTAASNATIATAGFSLMDVIAYSDKSEAEAELDELIKVFEQLSAIRFDTETSSGSSSGASSEDPELDRLKSIVELLKSELSILEEQNAPLADQAAKMREIQDALHDQAEYMRDVGAEQADINDLSAEWLQIQADIIAKQEELIDELENGVNEALEKAADYRDEELDKIDALIDREQELRDERVATLDAEREALEAERDLQEQNLELAEKELAVEEALEALRNAQNERTVRQYNAANNQWEWVADPSAVSGAQKDYDDALNDLQEFEDEKAYQDKLDDIDARQELVEQVYEDIAKELELRKQSLEDEYDALEQQLEDILDSMEKPLRGIEEVLTDIAVNGTPLMKEQVDAINAALGNLANYMGGQSATSAPSVSGGNGNIEREDGSKSIVNAGGVELHYDPNVDYAQKILDAETEGERLHYEQLREWKIQGEGIDLEKEGWKTTSEISQNSQSRKYDHGGVAKGKGFMVKDTNRDEIVLSPDITSEILNPQGVGGIENSLMTWGVSKAMQSGILPSPLGSTTNANTDNSHNYYINGMTYSKGDQELTLGQLVSGARNLKISS